MIESFLSQIAEEYDFVSRKLVEDYCSGSTVCTLERAQHVTATLKTNTNIQFHGKIAGNWQLR